MKTDTRFLFTSLIKEIDVDLCIDVGANNGGETILYKSAMPESMMTLCFEPSRYNIEILKQAIIGIANIVVYEYAVSNYNGKAKFYIDNYEDGTNNTGRSSLYERIYMDNIKEVVDVEVVRLDELILKQYNEFKIMALHIDVEGAGYEVLEGISKIKDRIKIIHIEVERSPLYVGQKIEQDIVYLMNEYGFIKIADDTYNNDFYADNRAVKEERLLQPSNIIFINKSIKINNMALKILYAFIVGKIHNKVKFLMKMVLPNRIHRKFKVIIAKYFI